MIHQDFNKIIISLISIHKITNKNDPSTQTNKSEKNQNELSDTDNSINSNSISENIENLLTITTLAKSKKLNLAKYKKSDLVKFKKLTLPKDFTKANSGTNFCTPKVKKAFTYL